MSSSLTKINLRNESIGGTACSALNFSDDIGDAVDVTYTNSDQVTGTYDIVINGSDAVDTNASGYPTHFNDPDSADPTATAVVYSASYASHYGRSDLVHERSGTYMVRNETHAS